MGGVLPTTSTTTDYETARDEFVGILSRSKSGSVVYGVSRGRKYDKVFELTLVGAEGRYMIKKSTREIFGVKSWTMINVRRHYGTLDTINDYDWTHSFGVPVAGTEAARVHDNIESQCRSLYKRRGRPRKAAKLSVAP